MKYEKFNIISLNIENQTDITSAFNNFFKGERLEDFKVQLKSGAKKSAHATLVSHIEKPPHILILHLKRFYYDPELERPEKLSHYLEFDEVLYLSKDAREPAYHEATWKDKSEDTSLTQQRYELMSVVVHKGQSAVAGHYITYARRGE